jgi:hypothetical protein
MDELGVVFNLTGYRKKVTVENDVRQLPTREIEQEIITMEDQYTQALADHSDVHQLSAIWQRIKALKEELRQRM